jgi:hypothetical protein
MFQSDSSTSPSYKPSNPRGYVTRVLWFVLGMVVATIYTSMFSKNSLTSNKDATEQEFERLREELEHVRNDNMRLRVSRDMAKKHLEECLTKTG